MELLMHPTSDAPGASTRAPTDDPIPIALYSCLTDTAARVRSVTWEQLGQALSEHVERDARDGRLWSPVTFKPTAPRARANANIERVHAFVFEYDHQEPPWALLDGLEYVAHTTHTHRANDPKCGRPDCPHWRGVVRIAEPIPADDFDEAWSRLVFWLAPEADQSCKDPSRAYYLPSCKPGALRETGHGEGAAVDWTTLRPVPDRPADDGDDPTFTGGAAKNGTGERPGDRFNREATWEEILEPTGARCVARLGDGSQRWRRPGKHDGHSATADGGGSRVLYVFTDGWPPFTPNTSVTRFRAHALLKHNGDERAAARALAGQYGTHERRNGHAPPSPPETPAGTAVGGLPEIMVSGRQLRDITADTVGALEAANDPPVLYQQRGLMARVRLDEQQRPITEFFTARNAGPLRGRMERVANFTKLQKAKGGETVKVISTPPPDVVADVLGLPAWPFPPLVGTIEAPALRPDGTIITQPGYDRATGLLYLPVPGLVVPPIPEHPTGDDVGVAAALLRDAIGEFPYADEPGSHTNETNAFGMLITPTIRPAIVGSVPLGLINKPRAGSGASLLVETVGRIATGRPPTTITAPKTEEEFRKKLTSMILDDPTGIANLDNLEATLASESLAAVLTSPEWSDRTLGSNAMARVPVRWTPFATGNNVRLGGDLPRRVYECRLDPKVARPWTRTGFRHEDLPGWVMAHRGELLGAVLTIARAWYAAGKPRANVPTIGGFDEWAQTVGGILAFAGFEGFLGNLVQLWENNDEEANEWEVFLSMWHRHWRENAVTVGTVVQTLHDSRGTIDECLPTSLVDSWVEAAGGQGAGSFKRRLGKALAKHTDTIYGPYRLENAGTDPTSKVALWRVRLVGAAPPNPGADEGTG
jgi:hypothetical protein